MFFIFYDSLYFPCRHSDFDGGAGVPYVDYICEINPEDGKMLQSLLREVKYLLNNCLNIFKF